MRARLPLWALLAALVAVLLVSLPTSQAAKPAPKKSAIAIRLTPGTVTVYDDATVEPTGVVVQVSPVKAGRKVTIQRNDGGTWTTVKSAATDGTGRVFLPLAPATLGAAVEYRTRVAASAGFTAAGWKSAKLYTRDNDGYCKPAYPLVDTSATGETVCLMARLDRWQAQGLMGVGQQLNISSQDHWADPLTGINPPAVIGFDLEELDQAVGFGYGAAQVQALMDLAHDGAVLVASWHATNPATGEPFNSDRINLAQILHEGTTVGDAFWADFKRKMALLKRFQIGDVDGDGTSDPGGYRTPIVFRPFHEANGGFFWWGKPDPDTYRQLWSSIQSRAVGEGVHNVLWTYSGNWKTSTTTNPASYVPYNVDIGGLDTYDPEQGAGNATDKLGLEGYSNIARANNGKVHRMALTEVGPHGSGNKAWNPAVISRTVKQAKIKPLWAMLWFDDGLPAGGDTASGYKQLNSLTGGKGWLKSCFNSLCYLR